MNNNQYNLLNHCYWNIMQAVSSVATWDEDYKKALRRSLCLDNAWGRKNIDPQYQNAGAAIGVYKIVQSSASAPKLLCLPTHAPIFHGRSTEGLDCRRLFCFLDPSMSSGNKHSVYCLSPSIGSERLWDPRSIDERSCCCQNVLSNVNYCIFVLTIYIRRTCLNILY